MRSDLCRLSLYGDKVKLHLAQINALSPLAWQSNDDFFAPSDYESVKNLLIFSNKSIMRASEPYSQVAFLIL
jgi:hypothetical protein